MPIFPPRRKPPLAHRDLGWRDSDIFDAAFHGASMLVPGTLMRAFGKAS